MPTLPPQPLQSLMNGADTCSEEFRRNIRRHNNAFAFTSTAVKVNDNVLNTPGAYSLWFMVICITAWEL